MSLEITGTLDKKLPVQSGSSARGPWKKQEFIVNTQEQYPKKVCISVWGEDKVKDLEKYQVGDKVKVAFNISSREFNGRWYTDLRVWRIEPAGGAAPAAPMPTVDDMPADLEDGNDDLPF